MTGVDLVKSGQGSRLYSFEAQQAAQTARYPETKYEGLLPFNHAAYELLFYFPFSGLSYRTGILAWAVLNLLIAVAIGWLMQPYMESIRAVTGVAGPLWIVGFYPVIYALGEGQDSLIFTLALVLSFRLLLESKDFLSGLALSLGCFKFHLAIMIAFFIFLLPARWRAFAGFVCGAILAGAISIALTGRNFAASYFHLLSAQEVMTPWGFIPWFMPNLRGFLHLILFSRTDVGTIFVATIIVSAGLALVVGYLILRCPGRDPRLLYIVGVLTTLLISYHLHLQDLAMAFPPLVLLLDVGFRNGFKSVSGIVLGAGIASLYGYRLLAIAFPWLLVHSSVMAAPLLLLWAISLVYFIRSGSGNVSSLSVAAAQHA